jgi:hypothetical protein
MDKLIKDAATNALVHLNLVTPDRFMEYLEEQRHSKSGMRLSSSAYGNKRSALGDLFRRHGVNPTPEFEKTLSTLFKGFLRCVTSERVEGQGDVKEGKDSKIYNSSSSGHQDQSSTRRKRFLGAKLMAHAGLAFSADWTKLEIFRSPGTHSTWGSKLEIASG